MLRQLSNEQAGEILKAICAYQDGEAYAFEDPTMAAVFAMISSCFQSDDAAYEESCRQNSENGAKGGRPKKATAFSENRPLSEKTDGFFEKAKKAEKDKDIDKDYKEKTPPKGGVKEKGEDPLSESGISEPLRAKIMEWLQYKRERREAYRATGYKSLITQLAKAEQMHGSLAVMDQIDTAMSSGWKGIGLDRLRGSPMRSREPTGAELAMQMAMEARNAVYPDG